MGTTAVRSVRRQVAGDTRGEGARQRLVQTAIEVFGAYGFDGASTRMLAQKAAVNLAAIPYYFGGKEGLYRAAAQFIVDRIGERLFPLVHKAEQGLKSAELSRAKALELLHELLNEFAAMQVGPGEADRWSGFLLREQMQPGAAFEIFYRGFMSRIHGTIAALLGRLFDYPPDHPALKFRAMTLLGQVLIFRTGRVAALRTLGLKRFSPDNLKLIQAILSEQVDSIVARGKPRQA